jgi:hypothetical protein
MSTMESNVVDDEVLDPATVNDLALAKIRAVLADPGLDGDAKYGALISDTTLIGVDGVAELTGRQPNTVYAWNLPATAGTTKLPKPDAYGRAIGRQRVIYWRLSTIIPWLLQGGRIQWDGKALTPALPPGGGGPLKPKG